jgi:inorganic pyrophosphatase
MTSMRNVWFVIALAATAGLAAQVPRVPPRDLPAAGTTKLNASLAAARQHTSSVWRDTAPTNGDGTVNSYIEIPRGERRKFEFNIAANARVVDRVMPESVGGYPVNYGFVPQTISYDGDPFDVLVLGPPVTGGTTIRGLIVGIMFMEDDTGLDSKLVVSPPGADGKPQYPLTQADRKRIGDFFSRYRQHEPGKFSRVPGWGSVDEARVHVTTTNAFFRECRNLIGRCTVR